MANIGGVSVFAGDVPDSCQYKNPQIMKSMGSDPQGLSMQLELLPVSSGRFSEARNK